MFSNRQVFLEHFSLPQAGSVANIPEPTVNHRGNISLEAENANPGRRPIPSGGMLPLGRVVDGAGEVRLMAKSASDEVSIERLLGAQLQMQAVRFGAEGAARCRPFRTTKMLRPEARDQYTTIVRSKPSQMVLKHPKSRRPQH